MSTQLFLQNSTETFGRNTNENDMDGTPWTYYGKKLSTSRGAGVTSDTRASATGPTAGRHLEDINGNNLVWYTLPLAADVTISGSITWNLRSAESSMNANAAINARLHVVDGATGALTLIDQTGRVTEDGTSEAAANFSETPGAGVACKRGDRLRVGIFWDDAGTMASGFTLTFWYAGTTAAASGDSYVTLTENLTFEGTPAGTKLFLTDTASDVATASQDWEAWTSRGGGSVNKATNTATGWTAGIQATDGAGGTVIDWFTKQLQAFTLGGAVECNVRAFQDTGARSSFRVEISRVDSDGTNATAWAVGSYTPELSTTDSQLNLRIAGDDLSVSDGQRLRIRLLVDDCTEFALVTAKTTSFSIDGTSAAAAGDTWVQLTQSVSEFVPPAGHGVWPMLTPEGFMRSAVW